MLILTRRAGQNIMIGDDIVISVIEVRGDAVRIGIQAPQSVDVHREEVYRELQIANQTAASSPESAVDATVGELLKSRQSRQSRAGAPETTEPDETPPSP